jgi:DNA-binding response OmpR family regulator
VTTEPTPPPEARVILVVEDDAALARTLRQVLVASGYAVWLADSGAAARAVLGQRQPALILLDLGLPDTDGLLLTPTLTALSAAPIIILTARAGQADRVLGLKLGADDFVAKPFDDEELLVRIEAVLRRGRPRPAPASSPPARLQVGPLTITRGGGPVTIGSTRVHLTPTEYRLLLVLADHADQVVSRATLLRQVWGYEDDDPSAGHLVDVHLGRLRLKLAHATLRAPALVTVRGRGYTLVSQPASAGESGTGDNGSAGGGPPPARLALG